MSVFSEISDLRFQCQPGCTRCCERQGFVYLAEQDLPRMARFLKLETDEFERRYVYRTRNRLRLRTPQRGRCIFLVDGGCSIHEVKPTQCRTFPYWPELVESRREWNEAASWCPGIGKGDLVTIQEIEKTAQDTREAYPAHYK